MKLTKIAQQLGSRGGKKSAESRLGGMTKEQRSGLMRKVRLSKRDKEILKEALCEEQRSSF